MKERPAPIRGGRIGWRVCVAGVVPLGLFAVRAVITLALTGDIPGNFILFRLRLRDPFKLQDFRSAVLVNHYCPHRRSR